MVKEKQIEKTAQGVCPLFKEYGSCERCDAEIDIDDEPCLYKCLARLMIENNYRKASEVVDEFVKRLKEAVHIVPTVYNSHFGKIVDKTAEEFKNRYTENKDKE